MTNFETARVRLIEQLRREIKDERVLAAMASTPREIFVPEYCRHSAYEDRPLEIGFGQTISQPFIVALMTEALELKEDEKVLELGTGSGYQAAILAQLARQVVTIERLAPLAETAKSVLQRLGYNNVEVHLAQEYLGWSDEAPYDAIIVTAGAPSVTQQLLDQLALGGRLVIPVGFRYEQDLLKITKGEVANITETLGACRFVPLIGVGAWVKD